MDDAPAGPRRESDYFSYLLRLWWVGEEGAGWRASLHDPHTGERVGFASVEEMFDFLQRRMGTLPGADGRQDAGSQRR
jgi:hypothetical protein